MKKNSLIIFISWLILLPTNVNAAPITFNTALPISAGMFVYRSQGVFKKISDDPSGMGKDMEVKALVNILGYGVTGDLAIFTVIPYLNKKLTTAAGVKRQTEGLGDISIFSRYTIYKKNRLGQTMRIAPFFGLQLPTGEDQTHDSLGIIPNTVQLGSGSLDPFGGIAITRENLGYSLDGQISYKNNRKANGFKFGDEVKLDASLQYKLIEIINKNTIPDYLYGVIESNFIYKAKNKTNGIKDQNSGGMQIYLTPGVQYATKRTVLEAVIQLPIFQNLNGTALKNDYTLRAGIRLNF